jgi:hypothetical protein
VHGKIQYGGFRVEKNIHVYLIDGKLVSSEFYLQTSKFAKKFLFTNKKASLEKQQTEMSC